MRQLRPILLLVMALGMVMAGSARAEQFWLNSPFASQPIASAQSAPASKSPQAMVSSVAGVPAADLATESVCPVARPDYAGCEAKLWVVHSSDAAVRPSVRRQPGPTAVTRSRSHALTEAEALGQTPPQAFTPAWLQQAYDLTYLSATAGAGRTVAIVDAWDDPTAATDLATYRSYFGLPPCTVADGCFTEVNQSGAASPLPDSPPAGMSGWNLEEALDLDAVSALCPNCHILFVEADSDSISDLEAAQATAAALGASEISDSWAASSPVVLSGDFTFPNVATVAATGDQGALPAGTDNYPAALPGVTAAGGTSLAAGGSGPRGISEVAWASGGSGCDTEEAKPSWQSDTGCSGRTYADISAQAAGMSVYSSAYSGWVAVAGTSESTPLIAAYYALTDADASTPAWDYEHASELNDIVSGDNDANGCVIAYICNAGPGYDGPSGVGSISGSAVDGAPGIGAPDSLSDYADYIDWNSASLVGGVYPNGLDTTYWWEYGTTTSYGQTTAPTDIGSATSPVETTPETISNLQPATTYHYRLVAENALGTTYGYDYTFTTAAAASAPIAQEPASISGAAVPTWTLTAGPGTWLPTGIGAPSYQWYVSSDGTHFTAIAGANTSSYPVTESDLGDYYEVAVTETNSIGATTSTSSAIGPVSNPGPPLSEVEPRILSPLTYRDASPVIGSTVFTDNGIWFGAGVSAGTPTYSYQWMDCAPGGGCQSIVGATADEYTIQSSDLGMDLEVTVTATDRYGSSSQVSNTIGPVTEGTPVPSSIGLTAPDPGQTPASITSSWSPASTTLSYQWQRSTDCGYTWTNIPGATAGTYSPTSADQDALLQVLVTGADSQGSTTIPAGWIPDGTDTLPWSYAPIELTTDAIEGGYLQVPLSGWCGGTDAVSSVTVDWQTNTGSGWRDSGVTSTLFDYGSLASGEQVRALVTASNADGSTTAVSDVWTGGSPQLDSAPVIGGTDVDGGGVLAVPGQTLSITNPLSSTSAESISYQWQYSLDSGWQTGVDDGGTWSDIPGATGTSLLISARYGTYPLRVIESVTNSYGTTEAASLQTWPVSAPGYVPEPAASSVPSIAGSATVGSTLTSTAAAWAPAATNTGYQWQDSADGGSTWRPIPSATGDAYTIGSEYAGDLIRLQETGSNLGQWSTADSSPLGPVESPSVASAAATGEPAPAVLDAPRLVGSTTVGRSLRVRPGTYSHSNSAETRFERCRTRCVVVGSGTDYRVKTADVGAYLVAIVSIQGPGGVITRRLRSSAPVLSSQVGAASVSGSGRVRLRSASGSVLASGLALPSKRAGAEPPAGSGRTALELTLTRAGWRSGPVKVWIYTLLHGDTLECHSWSTNRRRFQVEAQAPAGSRIELVARFPARG